MSILHNTYVDNVVTCVQNVAEAKKLYIESKELFAKASMNLRECSNSKEFFKGGREFMKPCKHCLTNRMRLLKNICSNSLCIIVAVKGCNCIVYLANDLYRLITSC